MAGFDPGNVVLRLSVRGNRLVAAEVRCDRPETTRLLRGKPADHAVALVPMIYTLCGKAQAVAARAALAAAHGEAVEDAVDDGVCAEAAREHAWKLLVDWPRHFGLDPDEAFFVRLMRQAPERPAEAAGALAAHPLPARLLGVISNGEIETLFAARITARLDELRDWLAGTTRRPGMVAATAVVHGTGEARVETARGPLVHRLVLDGEQVADYTITAPTDVHFAPDGELSRWLGKLKGLPTAEARRKAVLLVLAFDPCVPWELDSPGA